MKKLFLLMVLLGGLIAYSYTVGVDSTIGSTTRLTIEKTRFAVEDKLNQLGVTDRLIKVLEKSSKEGAPADQFEIRDACLEGMFIVKGKDFFTQSQWGAQKIPYQFRGLEVGSQEPVTLKSTDAGSGIDQRIRFPLFIETYRVYAPGTGWSEWRFDNPPHLDGIHLFRSKGVWKLAPGSQNAYSVR